jgi:hypothetical protein
MDTASIMAIVSAVLALINGEVASPIIAWLKIKLGITGGVPAFLLTVGEVATVTAGYLLLVTKSFTLISFLACTAYAVIRASGKNTEKKAQMAADKSNA